MEGRHGAQNCKQHTTVRYPQRRRPEIEQIIQRSSPPADLVHIQHTQFLSAIPFAGPMVWTFTMHGGGVHRRTLLYNNRPLVQNPTRLIAQVVMPLMTTIAQIGRFLTRWQTFVTTDLPNTPSTRKRVPTSSYAGLNGNNTHHIESGRSAPAEQQFTKLASQCTSSVHRTIYEHWHINRAGKTYKTFHMDFSILTTGTVTSAVTDCCL